MNSDNAQQQVIDTSKGQVSASAMYYCRSTLERQGIALEDEDEVFLNNLLNGVFGRLDTTYIDTGQGMAFAMEFVIDTMQEYAKDLAVEGMHREKAEDASVIRATRGLLKNALDRLVEVIFPKKPEVFDSEVVMRSAPHHLSGAMRNNSDDIAAFLEMFLKDPNAARFARRWRGYFIGKFDVPMLLQAGHTIDALAKVGQNDAEYIIMTINSAINSGTLSTD
jgi:hypothetical protein